MTDEPHFPQSQDGAASAAQIRTGAGENRNLQPNVDPADSECMQPEPQLEEIQDIPCGRIRRWDDGEITVSLGEFHS